MAHSRTLASLIVENQGLAISCTACPHNRTQDILALMVRYGQNAKLADLEPHIKACPKCGGRAVFEVWSRPDKEHPKRPA